MLVDEVLALLQPTSGELYLDATVGLGGHAAAILEASSTTGRLIGIDRDADALEIARSRLMPYGERVCLVHGNFAKLETLLLSCPFADVSEGKAPLLFTTKTTPGFGREAQSGGRRTPEPESRTPDPEKGVDGILIDLGVSSLQLDTPERGFSFSRSGRLDMRMDKSQSLTAADVVNAKRVEELARIFATFGEERWARRIAQQIVAARRTKPILTTVELADIVMQAIPSKAKRGTIHPATRVFQALRIYVNDELQNLSAAIDSAVSLLKPGGRVCVLSFHSLEDRIVKERFRFLSQTCVCPPTSPVCVCQHRPSLQILTKRPITPDAAEIHFNPRARSAKLRAATKNCES